MKTKKDILQWYDDKGNEMNDFDDMTDFMSKIDNSVHIEVHNNPKHDFRNILLTRHSWKHGIILSFHGTECFRICY